MSQTYLDNRLMKAEPQETVAQLETLRVLENAIGQQRRLLGQQHDYAAKIELTIALR